MSVDASEIRIRRAGPGEENTLSVIGAATFLEAFTFDIKGPALVAHCQSQHSADVYRTYLETDDPRYACWIAEYAPTGAPIGYAVACPPDLPVEVGDNDIELKRIYVFSRFHGSGAGKLLNEQVNAHAKALNCPRIFLGTYEENHRAIAFYKRAGYRLAGTRQFQVGDEIYDDIVMAMALV
ncbi:MAG: GNAT family N-acetyltransferase [Pseudomonadota bacterium]